MRPAPKHFHTIFSVLSTSPIECAVAWVKFSYSVERRISKWNHDRKHTRQWIMTKDRLAALVAVCIYSLNPFRKSHAKLFLLWQCQPEMVARFTSGTQTPCASPLSYRRWHSNCLQNFGNWGCFPGGWHSLEKSVSASESLNGVTVADFLNLHTHSLAPLEPHPFILHFWPPTRKSTPRFTI